MLIYRVKRIKTYWFLDNIVIKSMVGFVSYAAVVLFDVSNFIGKVNDIVAVSNLMSVCGTCN